MRRRHLRGVMAIERQVYPRPWSPNLFLSEMSESRNRCYLVARLDREVVGYGGLICYGEEAHVTNVGARRSAPASCTTWCWRRTTWVPRPCRSRSA